MHALAARGSVRYRQRERGGGMVVDQPGFGVLLRRYRMAAGLTQEALAERAGLSLRGVSDLERGLRRVPYPDTVERLVEALGLGAADQATLQSARQQMRASAPEDGVLLPPRSALPTPLTSFIGRERELGEIRGLFGTARLVTLAGAGGVGKTRLAVAAAQQQLTSFTHRGAYVALAGVGSPSLVASAIVTALGVSFSGPMDPSVHLVRYLRDKHLLLVLDSFEHLLDAAELLTDILSGAPAVSILVTSRERLNLQEEWVVLVEGLPFPSRHDAEATDQYPAVQLFVERARQVQADFSLAGHAQTVIDICQQVEGMPLALEVAATWLRVMPCDQIARQIERSLDFLTSRVRNVPDRHRSLRAVFDRSWSLLSEGERKVLPQLSVFRGSFNLAAAEQVAGASLSLLAGLADKSLIRPTLNGRYDLHELVRQYLSDKLVESGDVSAVTRRHFDFYSTLAEQAEAHLFGPNQETWFDHLEIDYDNLAAALTWSLTEEQVEAGLRLAGALGFFWSLRSHLYDSLHWLQRLLEIDSDAPASVRAKALRFAGVFMFGDPRARAYCEESLALAREADDKQGLAWSLADLGIYAESNLQRAAEELDEALALFRALGDNWGISHALRRLGWILMLSDEHERARMLLEEALTQARAMDDKNATAWALFLLGGVVWRQSKDHARATALYEESLALSIPEGNHRVWVLLALGEVAEALADHEHACNYYEEVLAVFQDGRVGTRLAAHGLARLGAIAMARGRPEPAARLFGALDALAALDVQAIAKLGVLSRLDFDREAAACRAQLGDIAYAVVYAQGRAMTMEQAVAYALHG